MLSQLDFTGNLETHDKLYLEVGWTGSMNHINSQVSCGVEEFTALSCSTELQHLMSAKLSFRLSGVHSPRVPSPEYLAGSLTALPTALSQPMQH